jgi:hypothetical protein
MLETRIPVDIIFCKFQFQTDSIANGFVGLCFAITSTNQIDTTRMYFIVSKEFLLNDQNYLECVSKYFNYV